MIPMTCMIMMIQTILLMSGQKNLEMEITTMSMMMHMITGRRRTGRGIIILLCYNYQRNINEKRFFY